MGKNLLLYASPETDKNIYYISRFKAPDPYTFIQKDDTTYLLASSLEYERAKKTARVDQVLPYFKYSKKLKEKNGKEPKLAKVISTVLEDLQIQEVLVPHNFPYGLALELSNNGIALKISEDAIFPQRLIKSEEEKNNIQDASDETERALVKAVAFLQNCSIKDQQILNPQGEVVTCEMVRNIIDSHLYFHGYLAKDTIVATGKQNVDPHNKGKGPIAPHQSLIIEIFPQSQDNYYCADMTRTLVKGDIPPELQKLYDTVLKAQQKALTMVKEQMQVKDIHLFIKQLFKENSYPTGILNGSMQGFFHGTGHGLGLDIHEAPRVSENEFNLQIGNVITIEPGLYYYKTGGVRIEDTVYVTKNGCHNFNRFPKVLQVDKIDLSGY